MKRVTTILFAAALTALGSCTKGIDEVADLGVGDEVKFILSDNSVTRVSEISSFFRSNTIGVFMEEGSSSIADNILFTVNSSSDALESDTTLHWPREDSDGTQPTTKIYAYSPYNSSATASSVPVDLIDDSYELLTCTTTSNNTASPVELSFNHALAKMKITFTPTVEYSELVYAYATTYTNATHSIVSGEFDIDTNTTGEVEFNVDSYDATAIFIPGTYSDGDMILTFRFLRNDAEVEKSVSLVKGDNTTNFSSGVLYTYKLTYGLDAADLSLTLDNITDWSSDDSFSAIVYSGSGTEADPWKISSESQLAAIGATWSSFGLDDHYLLTSDIALQNAWTPIGTSSNAFTGSFDGNGKTISGLSITNPSSDYQGLFGCLGGGAVVENLTVVGSIETSSYSNVGGIAGASSGSEGSEVTITDCISKVTLTGYTCVGGVVGNASYTTILRCGNGDCAVAYSSKVGGVVGYAANTTITDCYNTSSPDYTAILVGNTVTEIGFIVGYLAATSEVYSCYNRGGITAGEGSGINNIGGIAGYLEYGASINYCYSENAGMVTISGEISFGGLVGYVEDDGAGSYDANSITYSYYLSSITTATSAAASPSGDTKWTEVSSFTDADELSAKISYLGGGVGTNESQGYSETMDSSGYPQLTWQVSND